MFIISALCGNPVFDRTSEFSVKFGIRLPPLTPSKQSMLKNINLQMSIYLNICSTPLPLQGFQRLFGLQALAAVSFLF